MGDFKEIKTQEELNAIIADRLKRQKETIESKYTDYDEIIEENKKLKQQLSDTNSVLEKNKVNSEQFNNQIEELKGEISSYKLKNLKTDIALKHGIPYELASRLIGNTEEEITHDAKNLSGMLSTSESVTPLKSIEDNLDNKDSGYMNLIENLGLKGE